jgi:hypothetical protein
MGGRVDLVTVGKVVCAAGAAVALVGALLVLAGRLGLPLGSLPGDVRVQRPGFTLFVPVATSIALSLVLTVLLNVVIRLFRR